MNGQKNLCREHGTLMRGRCSLPLSLSSYRHRYSRSWSLLVLLLLLSSLLSWSLLLLCLFLLLFVLVFSAAFFRFSSIKLDHKLFCEERNSLKPQYVEVLAISVNYFNICELLTHPISIVVRERVAQEKGFCLLRHRGTELPVNTLLHHQNKTSRQTKAHFVHFLSGRVIVFLLPWVSCVNKAVIFHMCHQDFGEFLENCSLG